MLETSFFFFRSRCIELRIIIVRSEEISSKIEVRICSNKRGPFLDGNNFFSLFFRLQAARFNRVQETRRRRERILAGQREIGQEIGR